MSTLTEAAATTIAGVPLTVAVWQTLFEVCARGGDEACAEAILEAMVRQDKARLAGLPPVDLEMGARLLLEEAEAYYRPHDEDRRQAWRDYVDAVTVTVRKESAEKEKSRPSVEAMVRDSLAMVDRLQRCCVALEMVQLMLETTTDFDEETSAKWRASCSALGLQTDAITPNVLRAAVRRALLDASEGT